MPISNYLADVYMTKKKKTLPSLSGQEEPVGENAFLKDTLGAKSFTAAPMKQPSENALLTKPSVPGVSPIPMNTPEQAQVPIQQATPAPAPAQIPTSIDSSSVSAAPDKPVVVPNDSLSNYWGQKVIGNMPLDQFVQILGGAAAAISPDTPGGRLGAVMGNIGDEMYKTRMKREYEAPNVLLQRRLATAQVTGAENELKTNDEMQAFVKSMSTPVKVGDKTYNNQAEAWKAEGKDPDAEFLRMSSDIISKYDPVKGAELKSRLYTAKTANELKEAQLEARMEMFKLSQDIREKNYEALNKLREAGLKLGEERVNIARENAEKATDKSTEFERTYQEYRTIFEDEKARGLHPKTATTSGEPMSKWDFKRYLIGENAGSAAAAKKRETQSEVDKAYDETMAPRIRALIKGGGSTSSSATFKPLPSFAPAGSKAGLAKVNGVDTSIYKTPSGAIYNYKGERLQ